MHTTSLSPANPKVSPPDSDPQDHEERRNLATWSRQQARRSIAAEPAEARSIRGNLVLAHLWLADSVARRFIGKGEELDDLRQVARTALVEAVNRYDPEQGDLVPFAVPTISGLLKRYFRDHAWVIRPPRHTQEMAVSIRREWPDLAQSLGHQPTTADLAKRLCCTETEIRRAQLADRSYGSESLDGDQLASGRRIGPSDDSDEPSRADAAVIVRRACASLDRQDRWLLYMRFAEERTQSDIAQRLGTSQMQVSRRLARILRRMRTTVGSMEPAMAGGRANHG